MKPTPLRAPCFETNPVPAAGLEWIVLRYKDRDPTWQVSAWFPFKPAGLVLATLGQIQPVSCSLLLGLFIALLVYVLFFGRDPAKSQTLGT